MEKVDIIGTMGPSLCEVDQMERAVDKGLTVFRLNNSHMTDSFLEKICQSLKTLSEKGRTFALLFDTQGPEIRIGQLIDPINLSIDQLVCFFSGETQTSKKYIPINCKVLLKYLTVGDIFYVDDGKIELEIQHITGDYFTARVKSEGIIESKKGVNFPNHYIPLDILSKNDQLFLEKLIQNECSIDKLALSFVSRSEEVLEVNQFLARKHIQTQLIAKIENKQAIEQLEAILDVTDGIMVARGDLAVEIGQVKVPYMQKLMSQKAREKGKYVIVATQILDSMEHHATPTRAEVSDATNALFDGANALMLSGETAIGKYPFEAIAMLQEIIAYHSYYVG